MIGYANMLKNYRIIKELTEGGKFAQQKLKMAADSGKTCMSCNRIKSEDCCEVPNCCGLIMCK